MDSTSFSPQDAEAIYSLTERMTGNSVKSTLALANIARRMDITGCGTLFDYLRYAELKPEEMPYLISSLLVHTTSWFREEAHFEKILKFAEENHAKFTAERPMLVLSAACSTGEEVYSTGLVLEAFRKLHPEFDYRIEGRDIDVLCISRATKAVYSAEEKDKIPSLYRYLIREGSGKTEGLFTVSEEIRNRCKFTSWNLVKIPRSSENEPKFDWIFCRNVLIYFSPQGVDRVVSSLTKLMDRDGVLCVGHSESVDYTRFGLTATGNSSYVFTKVTDLSTFKYAGGNALKRVLVIDDSASVRNIMKKLLEGNEFEPVLADSAEQATSLLKASSFDLVTLDLHLPGEDGRNWLMRMRNEGFDVPVVIISDDYPSEALTTFGALESGAQDYFHKGQVLSNRGDLLETFRELIQSYRERKAPLSASPVLSSGPELRKPDLVLIGASIGGPDALSRMLREMSPDCPPIVVVQHISFNFAKAFAERLAGISGLKFPHPMHGVVLEKGSLYMADGDYHIGVRRSGDSYTLIVSDDAPEKRHRPSIDYLFRSVAKSGNCSRVFAAILTGMGSDGAQGMGELKKNGAMTFAQGAETSVVFGMAKEAIRLGAVDFVGDVADIRFQLDLALQSFQTVASVS